MRSYYRYLNEKCFYTDNYLDQNCHVFKVLAVPLVKWSEKLKPVAEGNEKPFKKN